MGRDAATESFATDLDGARAKRDVPGVALRAAAVAWRDHAILILGLPGSGKTTLAAALVRAGATPLADAMIRLDADGRVEAIGSAGAEKDRIPVALIVATHFDGTSGWRPEERRGARALLPLLGSAVSDRVPLQDLLRVVTQAAPFLKVLAGARPDADRIAPRILARADAFLGGRAPRARRAAVAAPSLTPADVRRDEDPSGARLRAEKFLLLLHWNGRFGNRMHQYAYGVTYARLNGCRFFLPSDWEGTHLFAHPHHEVLPRGELRAAINRTATEDGRPHRRFAALRKTAPEAVLIEPHRPRENYAPRASSAAFDSVCAYHPSLFAPMSRSHLVSVFEFSERVKKLDLYRRLEDRQGTYDIAHLRRDDISNAEYNRTHPQGYSVISKRSYEAAFARSGFDPAAVEWVSDDYTGQWHIDRLARRRGRWRYPNGSEVLPDVLFDWLEDYLRLYFARTIFRANSSFSWWAAFLAPRARVFSPVLDKKHIYGVDGLEEIDVEFVEGNHPHWMFGNEDIVLSD